MRKVLLATTALVAMTGAASAEVALSGYYEFGYTSVEDDLTVDRDTMFTDGEIHVNFSNVTDSGLTLGYHTEIVTHMHSAASTGNQIDDSYMSVAGDFGTFRLGENDTVESTFATYHPGGRNMITGDDWVARYVMPIMLLCLLDCYPVLLVVHMVTTLMQPMFHQAWVVSHLVRHTLSVPLLDH
jgi:hypothetical protein